MPSRRRLRHFGGIGEAFSDRNFRIHSIGAVTSWLSFFIQIVAVSWLTWELTQSTVWLAVMALLDIVPNVVLVPLGGVIADRFDRYKVMLIANTVLLLQAAAMALLAWFDQLTIWPLAALVLLHGIILSFSVPSMFGMLPRFVARARLSSAIAVNASYTQLAVFVGPAIAGWLISSHGIAMAFLFNAVGYCVLLGSQLCLKTPAEHIVAIAPPQTVWSDIVGGARYIFEHKGILALFFVMVAGKTLSMGFYHMLPAYSDQVLGMGVTGMSIVLASLGGGATITALWIAYRGKAAVSLNRVLISAMVAASMIGMMMLSDALYYIIPVAIIAGMAGELRGTGTITLIQIHVSEAQRGRVMGTHFMISQLAAGIGAYLAGSIAVSHGLTAPILTGAVLCIAVAAFYFLRRHSLTKWFENDKNP